jgi:hypothetical protein
MLAITAPSSSLVRALERLGAAIVANPKTCGPETSPPSPAKII